MKNNMQALFKGWRGFLLMEGRRENAASAIVKKINDPFLRNLLYDFATKSEGAGLAGLDPTPNKKYIEWAARRINDYARKEENDEYLQALANVQKNPEAYEPPAGSVYTPGRLELIKSYTPEERLQGGYLTNTQKVEMNRADAQVNITNILY